eukprot:CAMPEP_0195517592 /NCGR_PEP_ID=MMETSP0794_2-20130614/11029_1 /TAXON_ID=515487 /ORGANISM="Stephanopyxis turris, Strain CCMP 815" /LENGTH=242 /DNA_ID=CAMNT_0040646415 /DNA_START=73 /DNA_END=798 /DNA_ORIENTATION=-
MTGKSPEKASENNQSRFPFKYGDIEEDKRNVSIEYLEFEPTVFKRRAFEETRNESRITPSRRRHGCTRNIRTHAGITESSLNYSNGTIPDQQLISDEDEAEPRNSSQQSDNDSNRFFYIHTNNSIRADSPLTVSVCSKDIFLESFDDIYLDEGGPPTSTTSMTSTCMEHSLDDSLTTFESTPVRENPPEETLAKSQLLRKFTTAHTRNLHDTLIPAVIRPSNVTPCTKNVDEHIRNGLCTSG